MLTYFKAYYINNNHTISSQIKHLLIILSMITIPFNDDLKQVNSEYFYNKKMDTTFMPNHPFYKFSNER